MHTKAYSKGRGPQTRQLTNKGVPGVWAMQLHGPALLKPVDVPAPTVRALTHGAVLVRVLAGGICGSDVPKFHGVRRPGHPPPSFPGPPGYPLHEVVGEVVHSAAEDLGRGDRVVGWARRSDGLRALALLSADDLVPYPETLVPEDAVYLQPLACVLAALDRVDVLGRTVAVLGVGPIGLLFAHAVKVRGARRVIGVDPVRRTGDPAAFGLDDLVVGSSTSWSVERDSAPDVVIEAVGHQVQTFSDAVRAVAAHGTVLCFGIPDQDVYPLDMERLIRKNLTVVGGVTASRRRALTTAIAYAEEHPSLAQQLITHRLGRGEVQEAFELAAAPRDDLRKVVLSIAD